MKASTIVRMRNLNYNDMTITLSLEDPDENIFDDMESLFGAEFLRLDLSEMIKVKKYLSMEQQKKWFAMIIHILAHYKKFSNPEIVINRASINAMHWELKKSYFPVKIVTLGPGKDLPMVPSIRDMSMKEMTTAISQVISDYTDAGVDFEAYRQQFD